MALCLGHTAAGYLAYEAVRPADRHRPGVLAAAIGLANAPDLDFLPGLVIGQAGAFHRGVTHTILAVAAVTVATALGALLLGRGRRVTGAAALWAGAVWASHLLLDYFTTDTTPPFGARFLWPLSDRYLIAPVTPLSEVVIDSTGRRAFFAQLLTPDALAVWAHELAALACIVAAVHILRLTCARLAAAIREVPEV
jgi:membrane-bound metal-dependent hydrolase YbcI (DUF457 family)